MLSSLSIIVDKWKLCFLDMLVELSVAHNAWKKQQRELSYSCQRTTLLIGPQLIGYQVMSPNFTIIGIQVVNIENKFWLESAISAYPGAFQWFYLASVQINLPTFGFVLHFNSLNGIKDFSSFAYHLLHARCLCTCRAYNGALLLQS